MVGSNLSLYLVTGQDSQQRRHAIENIKKKVLQKLASPLNILTFYGKEIEIKDLRQQLLTFSFNKERIVIIKEAHSLSQEAKDFFINNFKKIISHNCFIFETDKDYTALLGDRKITSDKFFSLLFKNANIPLKYQKFSSTYAISFEGLRQCVRRSDISGSLYILEKLFESKNSDRDKEILGLQMLGFLVGECSYLRNPKIKRKYFDYLWDTDRMIKEDGIDCRFALEILLTKLLGSNFI
jgi:hypothetical protein